MVTPAATVWNCGVSNELNPIASNAPENPLPVLLNARL